MIFPAHRLPLLHLAKMIFSLTRSRLLLLMIAIIGSCTVILVYNNLTDLRSKDIVTISTLDSLSSSVSHLDSSDDDVGSQSGKRRHIAPRQSYDLVIPHPSNASLLMATSRSKANQSHFSSAPLHVVGPFHPSNTFTLEEEINKQRLYLENEHQKEELIKQKKIIEEEKYRHNKEKLALEKEKERMHATDKRLLNQREQQELQWATIKQQIHLIEKEKKQIADERKKLLEEKKKLLEVSGLPEETRKLLEAPNTVTAPPNNFYIPKVNSDIQSESNPTQFIQNILMERSKSNPDKPKSSLPKGKSNAIEDMTIKDYIKQYAKSSQEVQATVHYENDERREHPPDGSVVYNPDHQMALQGDWSLDLWEGLSLEELAGQGLRVTGSRPLRPFIDLGDSSAVGMKGRPESVHDMTDGEAEDRFYQLVDTNHLECAKKVRMGNLGDGGWDMCVSGIYRPQKNCIVYSFGIDNDFSFDDAIAGSYKCSTSAFDPSMDADDHRHSDRVYFYKMGLGVADGLNEQGWKIRTLSSIKQLLGHTDEVIDFLKIDIEYNEWTSFKTILTERALGNVKQLAFEIHTAEVTIIHRASMKEDFENYYNILLGIEKQGFRRYWTHYNPFGRYDSVRTGRERTCCYELYYVNIKYLSDYLDENS